jgi:CHAD domain-containing protein
MRVAVRRTRSALRLFTAELGPARAGSLREELRWLGGLLGAVRDLDVFLAGLDAIAPGAAAPPAALDALREQVASLREEHRTHLVRALQSTRYNRLLSRVQSIARPRGTRATAGPTVSQAAPEMVSRAVGRALKAARALGPDPHPEALHRLRILFKRARYACEFFREPFGGPMEAFIPEAVGFQDLLGALQDAQVAAQRVRWAAGVLHGAGRIDLEGSLGLGALIQAYIEEGRRNRRSFLKQWDGSHRALRRLRAEIRSL